VTTKRKFKSDAFEAIHVSATALHKVGAIDKATMREFLKALLAIAPKQIKRIRERAHVSQPVFARYLNTSESTVQKWEAGTKRAERHGAEVAGGRREARLEGARLIRQQGVNGIDGHAGALRSWPR
jgi:putative transcriptional regulator